MKLSRFTPLVMSAAILCAPAVAFTKPPGIRLSLLDSVTTPVSGVSAAEIAAHDPSTQRVFVVNAAAARIDVLDITNPSEMKYVDAIDVKPFGNVANSVAVHDGIIAVAIEPLDKTQPGKVVFYNSALNFLSAVTVGALPDMVTFTPNGRYVLVANEGEPNDLYTADPAGTVSIIDLSEGAANLNQSSVRSVDFTKYNGAKLPAGVRVFGPNATTATNIEPEYITVSNDSKTAWVTCQENNAIAIIDVASAKLTDLVSLGFKDHSIKSASLYDFTDASLPIIGTTAAGQSLKLGGFSGLNFEGIDPVTGKYKFIANTDRGPNAEPTGIVRPFLLPNFTPELVRFELDRVSRQIQITQRIPLKRPNGQPLTGLPNTALSGDANQAFNDEVPVDLLGQKLPLDPLGADLEGIAVDHSDGSFWMVDEYRPAIYHFSPVGVLLNRYVPQGTAAAAGQPEGTFGVEALPAVLAQRRQNRGFEAVALDNGKIYAFVQSPLRNPVSLSNAALTAMRNVRLVEFDPVTLQTRQFVYIMDNADLGLGTNTRADKIGDAAALGNGEFLVVERDDDKIQSDDASLIEKRVYRFSLNGATDISTLNGPIGTTGKTVDQLTDKELAANNIKPITKALRADLNRAGYNRVEKVEGLTVIDENTIALINDNDFGVANITVNPDGTFVRNYVPEPCELGIIEFPPTGLDASDADGRINITNWPVKGMYQPDAIASYQVKGKTYLVTANEGDAREYTAFSEVARVGSSSVVLDPIKFPDAAFLKNNAQLGRLNITTTLGRNSSGKFEELYAFGGRSFSIHDERGVRLFDSGDDFEKITAAAYPANFNASNSNNTFDNRSDDKGPEPEGVTIGKVFGRTYAFICLERIGGIMVYDVSDPEAPEFVQYLNNRDFSAPTDTLEAGDLGPEGILFISEENSPTGVPLVVTASEVSGSTSIFEIQKVK